MTAGSPAPDQPVSVDLWRVALRLRRPHAAAHGSESLRSVIVVRVLLADGTEGWGECSALGRPTYTGEFTAGAWLVLRDELAPALLAQQTPSIVGHPMAVAGITTAWTDAVLRRDGTSLAAVLAAPFGAPPAASIPVCAVVGLRGSTNEVVAEVAERIEHQAAMVKLKVTPARDDLAAVEAVRDGWPDLPLAVDFNGTADIDALRRLDRLSLAYIEQPAPAEDLVASAHFAAQVSCPIALDESISSSGALDAAVALQAGSVVNVKPARCGGPRGAASLVARARAAGWDTFVGGMIESGVGRAAALAVAALPEGTMPTDLGPSMAYFDLDLTDPLDTDGRGQVVTPTGPGIGRTPHVARLEAHRADHLTVEA
jgi:o-succinylbenzoate synthase